MKKKIIITLILVISLALIISFGVLAEKFIDEDILKIFNSAKKANSNDKTVVAIVNGKEIYQETIDFLASGEGLSKNNTQQISEDTNSTYDKDVILKKQVRNAVVLSEAERLGLTASYKEAEEYTKENYNLVKEIGGETYQIIKDYMAEMEMSEDEYLKKSTEVNRNMLTRAKLYDNFIKDKNGTNEELLAEYENYVDELIDNADIDYKN